MQARASLTPTEWLLKSDEPAIAFLTRRDVLGEHVEPDPEAILAGPIVRGLLDGQRPDGGFGSHPYKKWTGAHWRLVSLVELGVPTGHAPAIAAAETVLDWLTGKAHRRLVPGKRTSTARTTSAAAIRRFRMGQHLGGRQGRKHGRTAGYCTGPL